jgi:hypothetical protein
MTKRSRYDVEVENASSRPLVLATVRRSGDGDYTQLAIQQRQTHDGQTGVVIGSSNSHGICHEVLFADSTTAWFDPEELTPCGYFRDRLP